MIFYQTRVEFNIANAFRITSGGKLRSSSEILYRRCPPDFQSFTRLLDYYYQQERPPRNTALMVLLKYCADLKIDIENKKNDEPEGYLQREEKTFAAAIEAGAYLADREWLIYDSARPAFIRRVEKWGKTYREMYRSRRRLLGPEDVQDNTDGETAVER